ncbi:MAG: hypothetical protein ACRD18_04420 [Terriglobia bacterium]
MTKSISNRPAEAAAPSGPQGRTVSARTGAERKTSRHLYENLFSNVESQINIWIRTADGEPKVEIAQALRLKAEGLRYALRLLFTFKPDFQELVQKARKRMCQGCGADLDGNGYRQATTSGLCDACYEIGRDEEMFIAENACDFDYESASD